MRDYFLISLPQGARGIVGRHDDDDFLALQHEREAGRRIRTDDLLITNQLLYQLSYAGICRRRLGGNAAFTRGHCAVSTTASRFAAKARPIVWLTRRSRIVGRAEDGARA